MRFHCVLVLDDWLSTLLVELVPEDSSVRIRHLRHSSPIVHEGGHALV